MEYLGTRVSQIVLAAAIVASLAGGLFLVVKASTGGGIEIVLPTATAPVLRDFKVYITGAVETPGVYEVAEGSRLQDVVAAAGGATEDAEGPPVDPAKQVHHRPDSPAASPAERASCSIRTWLWSAPITGSLEVDAGHHRFGAVEPVSLAVKERRA